MNRSAQITLKVHTKFAQRVIKEIQKPLSKFKNSTFHKKSNIKAVPRL